MQRIGPLPYIFVALLSMFNFTILAKQKNKEKAAEKYLRPHLFRENGCTKRGCYVQPTLTFKQGSDITCHRPILLDY